MPPDTGSTADKLTVSTSNPADVGTYSGFKLTVALADFPTITWTSTAFQVVISCVTLTMSFDAGLPVSSKTIVINIDA
jgi:hypothetical protein